jgi:hypothetical protein
VLHGRLVERSKDVEEKLVDVQCAIQIARSAHEITDGGTAARAIVVMSEDMDLIPAYAFAGERGVPVFAASHATVDTRPDAGWLLLPEAVLRTACGRPRGRYAGHELRRQIATWCASTSPIQISFRVQAWDRSRDRAFLEHNSGARGIWASPPPSAANPLSVTGLSLDDQGRDFPTLTVGPVPAPTPLGGFVDGEVLRWRTPTRVEVSIGGRARTLSGPIGSLLPGGRVLVQEYRDRGQPAWRLVGALAARGLSDGWPDPTLPRLARVIQAATSPGARVRAVLLGSAQEVSLQPPRADVPRVGDEYAVVPIGAAPAASGSRTATIAVSSRLR